MSREEEDISVIKADTAPESGTGTPRGSKGKLAVDMDDVLWYVLRNSACIRLRRQRGSVANSAVRRMRR